MIKNQEEYFKTLSNLIKAGYQVLESKFPYLKLGKENDIVELDLDIKRPLKKEIIQPDYNNSLINIIDSIKANYGKKPKYKIDNNIFDKQYKNTVILILDGMGKNILDEFSSKYPNNFLSKHLYTYLNAIYPSTTACATTSIKSGLLPIETGWSGWANYFKEVDKDLVLFNGTDYYTGENYNINAYTVLPYKPYFDSLNIKGAYVEPDFSKKCHKLEDVLSKCLSNFAKGIQTMYVYDTEPDGMLHKFGTLNDEIYKTLNKYSKQIEKFYKRLPKNTLLLISADHGHIDSTNIKFYLDEYLYSMLLRKPTNDSRCLTFKVKDNKKAEFRSYFNSIYSNVYELYSKEEFINEGFMGQSENVPLRLSDFLADFIAVAKTDYTFALKEKALEMKSNHAGITVEEMIIPLIVLKK